MKTLTHFKTLLKNNKYSIGLFFILFALCLVSRLSIKPLSFSSIFWSLSNTTLFILLFFSTSRLIIRYPLVLLLSLIAALDIGLFFVYKNPMHYAILASIFETNLNEASEVGGIAILVGVLSCFILCYLGIKSSQELKNIQWNRSISFLLFLLLLVGAPLILIQKEGFKVTYNIKKNAGITLSSAIGVKYPFVFNDFFLGALYVNDIIRLNRNHSHEKLLPEGVVFEKQSDIDKVIFVIGESSTRLNYSLYGYPVETTPFLDSLNSTGRLSFYQNVFSPAGITRDAMRLTLTYAVPQNSDPFYNNKSIVDLANSAGYETYWITNHGNFDIYSTYVDQVKSKAKYLYDANNSRKDDLELVDLFQKLLKPDERQFFTLHLIGSHVKYETKYDEEDEKAIVQTLNDQNIDYDRSIHHTDRVLKYIYNLIRDSEENIVIFYYSDHGIIIDTGQGLPPFLDRYKVPLIVINNKPDCLNSDSIINKYYDTKSGIYNTTNNIYVLSEIMGYKVSNDAVQNAIKTGLYLCDTNENVISIPFLLQDPSSQK